MAAAALVGVLGAAAVFSAGPPAVHAAPANLQNNSNDCGNSNKQAIASGNTFECDYFTTTIFPAATNANEVNFKLTLNGPAGTAFTGATTDLPSGCTVTNTTNTVLKVHCANDVPAGSEFGVLLTAGNTPGQITMTAAYGKNGNLGSDNAIFEYQFDATGADGPAAVVTNGQLSSGPFGGPCDNTTAGKKPNDPVAVGDTFDCVVSYHNLVTPGHAVVTPDAGANIGGFTVSGGESAGLPNGLSGYLCGSGPQNINCDGYTIHGTATAVGEVIFDQDYYALGANKPQHDADVVTNYFIIGSTATALTVSPSPATIGHTVTLTATVTPSTGCILGADFVRFSVDGTALTPKVAVINGVATTTYTPTTAGKQTVKATYLGNTNCGASSDTQPLTVHKAHTTTTLSVTPSNNVPANTTIQLSGTVTSGMGCTFTAADLSQVVIVDGNGVPVAGVTPVSVNLNNGNIVFSFTFTTTNAGAYNFQAKYEGNDTCAASASTLQTINATSAAPNLSLTVVQNGPYYVGQPLTLDAAFGSLNNCTLDVNGDLVRFFYNGANLISSQLTANGNTVHYQTPFTPTAAGSYTFKVYYVPSANNFDCQGANASVTITVTQAGTTTKLLQTSGNATVSPGASVQYEAIVTADTGCVLTLNNQPNPDSVTFTVKDSNGNVVYSQISTLADNGNGGSGDAFLNMPPPSLNAGTYSVSVAYDNSANCGTSSAGPLTLTVGATPTTLALTSNANPVKVNHTVTFTATITANAAGCAFQVLTDPAPVFSYNGVQLNPVGGPNKPTVVVGGPVISNVGNGSESWTLSYNPPSALGQPYAVTASWAGNASCGPSNGSLAGGQGVTIGTATVAVTSSPNPSTGNQQLTIKATVTPDLAISGCVLNDSGTGTVQFTYNGSNIGAPVALTPGTPSDAAAETATVTFTPDHENAPAGETITAQYSGDASCAPATGSTSQVVNLAGDVTALTGPNQANPQVGSPVTFTARVDANQFCVLGTNDVIDLYVNGIKVYSTNLGSATSFTTTSAQGITLSYTPTSAGPAQAYAQYEGNLICGPSNSGVPISFTVIGPSDAPNVNLSAPSTAVNTGTGIQLTATVTANGGCTPTNADTVTFSYNSTTQSPFTSGAINLSGGMASMTTGAGSVLPSGVDQVTITYTSHTPGCASSTPPSFPVTVNSVGNGATTNHDFNYTVGVPLTNLVLGTISDPSCVPNGANKTVYTVTIDWGDNTTSSGAVASGCGTANVTGSHTYAASGVYTVKVTITGTPDFFSGTITDTATPVSNNNNNNSGNQGGNQGGYTPPLPYNGNGYQPNPGPYGPI